MTQQDIVNELNRMVLGYNLTWEKIKYDADRAIMKINAHLGAEYPRMSEIMLAPHSRYTLKAQGKDTPIFPERYLLTVVIPFIASEVLARDEEFTTIYNKYVMDVENGLFDMFQNEYNKVPLMFRQDADVGVFFSKDVPEHELHKHINAKLPVFEFNVYYYCGNTDVVPNNFFAQDLRKYPYGSSVTCVTPSVTEFQRGIYWYTFRGWSTSSDPDATVVYSAGETISKVYEDLHLYAVWDKECVLTNNGGTIMVKSQYYNKITTLVIPDYVDGMLVKSLDTGFTTGLTKLTTLILPKVSIEIKQASINSTTLQKLVLPPYDYLKGKPIITIASGGIYTPNVEYLYIPYGVTTIAAGGVTGISHIQCEVSERPTNWHAGWTDATLDKEDWGVVHG